MKYLSAEMVPTLSAEDVGEYPLPWDPQILVRVKSQSVARMKQYSDAEEKGGSFARAQQYQLVADSIIDEHDQPVFDFNAVKQMGKTRTRLYKALVQMISHHNGSDDKIETAEKNSGRTDTEDSSSDSV